MAAVLRLEGTAGVLGVDDVDASTVFFVGLGAGVAILWGIALLRFGTNRSMRQRCERKRMHELSTDLERAEGERRQDGNRHRDSPSP